MENPIVIGVRSEADILFVQSECTNLVRTVNFSDPDMAKISTNIRELSTHILKYATKGKIKFSRVEKNGKTGVLIEAIDRDPAIQDVEKALTDRYSTEGTLGLGLPGVKRIAEDFEIATEPGKGTPGKSYLLYRSRMTEIGGYTRQLVGERYNGDSFYIDQDDELAVMSVVGGDFYDFYFIDENHFCFVVGDVSGKGVPAAVMMAVTKTQLKSQANSDRSTASIMTHVHIEIARDNEASMFITIFMAILDTVTGELVYSNAGHNSSFVLHSSTGKLKKLTELHGPVVGALPELTYKEARVQLLNDDCVFANTDGVTGAQDFNNELFSDPRLEEFLAARISQKPEDLVTGIIDEVKLFEKGKEQADDITVLAIRYNEDPQAVTVKRERIEITNKLEEIAGVQKAFGTFAEENNIPVDIARRLNIAFDEIQKNIISYAFTAEKEHVIEVQMELKDMKLVITNSDDGIPFNPFSKTAPDITESVEEPQIGGLGIHLVKKMVDRCSYVRITNNNIMTLVKKI